eukprot:CAMPEP_0181345374 /NCGR_PEP_ID=MMETSP1101-20121128/32712_1 /TAXON_ID=46948 /ORGANISM="Rhodomonas abbreviata, Strain Caron Lab Isolate" /LENGTH=138 /DNA_ID=CAMNT_0023457319 /DNA_START=92 /DNA_END=504 /DNA_ORIENTATION=+
MAFAGATICITGALSQTRSTIEKGIKALGGDTSSSVTAKTTHLVANEAEYQSKTAKVNQAEGRGLPIVSEDWLTACKAKGKLVPWGTYLLAGGGGGSKGAAQTADSPVKMSKAAAKAIATAAKAIRNAGASAPAPAPA